MLRAIPTYDDINSMPTWEGIVYCCSRTSTDIGDQHEGTEAPLMPFPGIVLQQTSTNWSCMYDQHEASIADSIWRERVIHINADMSLTSGKTSWSVNRTRPAVEALSGTPAPG